MNKRFLYALIIVFSLNACEKDFVIKDQAGASKMVINSQFSNNGKMNVYVTSSYSTTGANPIEALDDAIVELYEDNLFKEQMRFVNSDTLGTFGKFQSSFNAVKGKKYSIKVTHQNYEQADAIEEQVIPVQILNNYITYYPADSNDKVPARFKLFVQDDGAKENYYKLTVWSEDSYSEVINQQGDTIMYSYNTAYKVFPTTYLTDTTREWDWNLFFSDRNFNGEDKEIEFKINAAVSTDRTVTSKLWFELRTVSKNYYNYYKTLELYRYTNNANAAEPSFVYSNINNGYGIFASYNAQTKSMKVN